jgi:hypothetical protein
MDPDPGGPKTCRSCGSGSPTLNFTLMAIATLAPTSTAVQAEPVLATQRENRLKRKKRGSIIALLAEERGVGETGNSSDSNKNFAFFTSPCSRVRSQEGQKSGSSITNIIYGSE